MTTPAELNACSTAAEEIGMQSFFANFDKMGNKCSCSFQNNMRNNKEKEKTKNK
jgi:hypothetical protein